MSSALKGNVASVPCIFTSKARKEFRKSHEHTKVPDSDWMHDAALFSGEKSRSTKSRMLGTARNEVPESRRKGPSATKLLSIHIEASNAHQRLYIGTGVYTSEPGSYHAEGGMPITKRESV